VQFERYSGLYSGFGGVFERFERGDGFEAEVGGIFVHIFDALSLLPIKPSPLPEVFP
jgi:hypothetical protein